MSKHESTTSNTSSQGCKPLEWEQVPWLNPKKRNYILDQIKYLEKKYLELPPDEQNKGKAGFDRKKQRIKAQLHNVENNGEKDWGGLERAKVPGGWLVRQYEQPMHKHGGAASMTFVPDPNYEWK